MYLHKILVDKCRKKKYKYNIGYIMEGTEMVLIGILMVIVGFALKLDNLLFHISSS